MKKWLIIDGYNLIYRAPALLPSFPSDIPGKRRCLLQMLDEMAGVLASRVTVVFDGGAVEAINEFDPAHVEAVFSPPGKTADTVIEQMVYSADHPGDILVVTSDRSERENVMATGAETMSCRVFLEFIKEQREYLLRQLKGMMDKAPAPCVGDYFPDIRNTGGPPDS